MVLASHRRQGIRITEIAAYGQTDGVARCLAFEMEAPVDFHVKYISVSEDTL